MKRISDCFVYRIAYFTVTVIVVTFTVSVTRLVVRQNHPSRASSNYDFDEQIFSEKQNSFLISLKGSISWTFRRLTSVLLTCCQQCILLFVQFPGTCIDFLLSLLVRFFSLVFFLLFFFVSFLSLFPFFFSRCTSLSISNIHLINFLIIYPYLSD